MKKDLTPTEKREKLYTDISHNFMNGNRDTTKTAIQKMNRKTLVGFFIWIDGNKCFLVGRNQSELKQFIYDIFFFLK